MNMIHSIIKLMESHCNHNLKYHDQRHAEVALRQSILLFFFFFAIIKTKKWIQVKKPCVNFLDLASLLLFNIPPIFLPFSLFFPFNLCY
jgi:hypothetical protein